MSYANRSLCKALRRERSPSEKLVRLTKSWKKGQNPTLSVINQNLEERNKVYVIDKADNVWGKFWLKYDMFSKENRKDTN